MGRLNSIEEHIETVRWGNEFEPDPKDVFCSSFKELLSIYKPELQKYFALSVLAQSKSAETDLVQQAQSQLFRIRVQLEKSIAFTLNKSDFYRIIEEGSFFGASKKQGISVRFPLWTCEPTILCSNRCYAHDTLDAAPASVIRGAINGLIADRFESGSRNEKMEILSSIGPDIRKAIKESLREASCCGWSRSPRIRFSHVGDIVAYVDFANEIAKRIIEESKGRVVCVVYTRRHNAIHLNPDLWVVNFTLDSSSLDRTSWIPSNANTVFSAFDGITSESAYVNYLEHHRWSHCSPKNNGIICPATLPETKDRTCDALRCDRCFVCSKSEKKRGI